MLFATHDGAASFVSRIGVSSSEIVYRRPSLTEGGKSEGNSQKVPG
jgi:hypothetical protein